MHKSSRRLAKVRSGERRYADCRKGLNSGLCIETACWRLVRKEQKEKYHSLIFKVWNWKNLNDAWEKVKQNRGAAGIDDVTIEEFERNLEQNLNEIQRLLREGRYVPNPVKRVYIPKPDGKRRPLGIPTIRDRVVQQALKNVIYFDVKMAELGYEVVRYADDFLVLCGSKEEANEAISDVKEILEELELTLHPDKTKIKNFSEGVDFLGFTVYISHKVPQKKAIKQFKDAVRRATRRNLPINLEMVIQRLNPVVIGWGNYFKIANVNWLYKGLDSWTRMRLRAFREKKKSYLSNTRITNEFLENLGLKSLSTLLNPEW